MEGLAPLEPLQGPMGGLGPMGAVSGTNPLGGFGKSGTMQGLDGGNADDPFNSASLAPPLILRCKIVLLGDSTVGKTSLAQVFQGGVQNFPKNYSMTVGIDFMVKKVSIPDTNVIVEMYIVDCGGFSVCQELLKPHWE